MRVKIHRHVQGEKTLESGEKETLTKGSVVDVSEQFGRELIASKAAEEVDKKEKLHEAPIRYPEEEAESKKSGKGEAK